MMLLLRETSQLMVDYSREYGLALWRTYGEFGLFSPGLSYGRVGCFRASGAGLRGLSRQ